MIKCSRKNVSKSCAPQFDGLVLRATGEQVTRVKCDRSHPVSMAFQSSQQTSSVRVPKVDGPVRPTRKNIVGSECH